MQTLVADFAFKLRPFPESSREIQWILWLLCNSSRFFWAHIEKNDSSSYGSSRPILSPLHMSLEPPFFFHSYPKKRGATHSFSPQISPPSETWSRQGTAEFARKWRRVFQSPPESGAQSEKSMVSWLCHGEKNMGLIWINMGLIWMNIWVNMD
jgi:hypothetical protein